MAGSETSVAQFAVSDSEKTVPDILARRAAVGTTLVTGATGFIGAHLCKALPQLGVADVVASARDGRAGARYLDVRVPSSLRDALPGVDTVVHCATGNRAVAVEGTRNLLRAAVSAGVRRVVHFSSVAVYAANAGELREDAPHVTSGQGYPAWKAAAEEACLDQNGIDIVRLRPSIVYGPGGWQWLLRYVQRIRAGRWNTFGEAGEGICNLVHLADIAGAVAAAIRAPGAAAGQAFNVNGPEATSWNEWFRMIAASIGENPLRPIAPWRVRARTRAAMVLRLLARGGIPLGRDWQLCAPQRSELAFFASKVTYPTTAAQTVLGWRPSIGLVEGLRLSLPPTGSR